MKTKPARHMPREIDEPAVIIVMDRVVIEGPETDPTMTHIERINRDTPNPAHVQGLDIPHHADRLPSRK